MSIWSPIVLLRTCRLVRDEASKIVDATLQRFEQDSSVLDSIPKLIAHVHQSVIPESASWQYDRCYMGIANLGYAFTLLDAALRFKYWYSTSFTGTRDEFMSSRFPEYEKISFVTAAEVEWARQAGQLLATKQSKKKEFDIALINTSARTSKRKPTLFCPRRAIQEILKPS